MWMLARCEREWVVVARRWWLIAVLQLQVRLLMMTPEDVTPQIAVEHRGWTKKQSPDPHLSVG
jgi:hypothetical protein